MDTLAEVVRHHAAHRPSHIAVRHEHSTMTFAQLDARSTRCANGLRAVGVRPGDRVAVLDRNCPEYLELAFGVGKIGAVLCGVNFRLAAREVTHILNDCGAQILFVGAEFVALIETIESELTAVRTVLVIGASDRWPDYHEWLDAASADEIGT